MVQHSCYCTNMPWSSYTHRLQSDLAQEIRHDSTYIDATNIVQLPFQLYPSSSIRFSKKSTMIPLRCYCTNISSPSSYTHRLQSDFPRNPPWFNIDATVLTSAPLPAIPIVFNQIFQEIRHDSTQYIHANYCLVVCFPVLFCHFFRYISQSQSYIQKKKEEKNITTKNYV